MIYRFTTILSIWRDFFVCRDGLLFYPLFISSKISLMELSPLDNMKSRITKILNSESGLWDILLYFLVVTCFIPVFQRINNGCSCHSSPKVSENLLKIISKVLLMNKVQSTALCTVIAIYYVIYLSKNRIHSK